MAVPNVAQMRQQRAQANFFFYFPNLVREFTLFCGQHGKGKTVSMVYLTRQMARYLERTENYKPRVVAVASEIGLTPEFGEFTQMQTKDFICQLSAINDVAEQVSPGMSDDEVETLMLNHRGCANPAHNPNLVQWGRQWITPDKAEKLSDKQAATLGEPGELCWTAQNGVLIYRSVILCDEAHELLSADMSANPVVRLMCNFIAKMRHFKITLFVAAPSPSEIAVRARTQVKWEAWCNTRKKRDWANNTDVPVETSAKITRPGTYGNSGLFTIKFDPKPVFPMYDSHQVLSFSKRALTIDAKFI